MADRSPESDHSAMSQLLLCMWSVVGAALLVLSIRTTATPVGAWIGLTLLLRASRGMATLPAIACAVIALYAALAVGVRGAVPVSGATFFAVIAAIAGGMAAPLIAD